MKKLTALFSNSKTSQRFLLNFSAKIAPGIIGILSIGIFTKYIGLEAYAVYSIAFIQASLVSALLSSWLNQAQLRFTKSDAAYVNFFKQCFWICVISIIVNLFISLFTNNKDALLPQICLTIGIIFYNLNINHLISTFKSKDALFSELSRSLIGLIIPFVALRIYPEKAILIGATASYVLVAIIVSVVIYKRIDHTKDEVNFSNREIFKFGWALSGSLGISEAVKLTERTLLLKITDLSTLGLYSALLDFYNKILAALTTPLTITIHPQLSRSYDEGDFATVAKTIKFAVLGVVAYTFVICLASYFNVFHFLQNQKNNSLLPNGQVVLLIIGLAVLNLGSFLHKGFELNKKTHHILLGKIISSLAYLFLIFRAKSITDFVVATIVSGLIYILYLTAIYFTTERRTKASLKLSSKL